MIAAHEIAAFKINAYYFLDENAQLIQDPPSHYLDPQQCRSWFHTLHLARTFDQKAIALQRTGKLGTYPSCAGQEAIGTVLGSLMQSEDVLFPYYRDLAAQIQRGVLLEELLAFWGGDERGNCYQQNHDFCNCIPIASQCLHAAGAAYALRYLKKPQVVATVLGDGATSKGDFYEAINVAGVWKLPMVFIVNNNQWAISVSRSQQTAAQTLAQKAIAAGFEGVQVDGNDIFAVAYACEQAISKARNDKGPTLIEAVTYRLGDHTTADDASRYRDTGQVAVAQKKEPLHRFSQFLIQTNILDQAQQDQIIKNCREEVQTAVDKYLARAPQAPQAIFDHLYANLPKSILEQRQFMLDQLNE